MEKQNKYDGCNSIFNGPNSFSKTDYDAIFMHMKYAYLKSNKQEAYIKPSNYAKSKTRKFKNDISKKENMIYNEGFDYYICASNKKFIFKGIRRRKSNSGYESEISIYECEDCSNCEYKTKCTKAKNNKQLHVTKNFIKFREESQRNITTEKVSN